MKAVYKNPSFFACFRIFVGKIAFAVLFILISGAIFPPGIAAQENIENDQHHVWSEILQRYLQTDRQSNIALFDYAAVNGAERAKLDRYIKHQTGLVASALSRDRQLAYWINLYNALTVKLVLDHYPVSSIRDINPASGFFDRLWQSGPWRAELVTVEGVPRSLDDIEQKILLPLGRDPRIHYAINCASLGCPDLANKAFTAGRLEPMLDAAARRFINHPRALRTDGEKLYLSSIYDWYRKDFGRTDREVIEHLMGYAEPGLRARLQLIDHISGYDYDWALNDVAITSTSGESGR